MCTLKEETFAGRNFRCFSIFGLFRENLFHEMFQNTSPVKVISRKISKNKQKCVLPYYLLFNVNYFAFFLVLFILMEKLSDGKCHPRKFVPSKMRKFHGSVEMKKFLPAKAFAFKVYYYSITNN